MTTPLSAGLLAAALLAGTLAPAVAQVPDSSFIRRALRLHRAVPMVDAHNDLPWELRTRFAGSVDSARLDRAQPLLHTDMPRLRAGGVGAQFWSIYTDTETARALGSRAVMEQMDIVRRLEQRFPDVLMPARTADDIMRAHRAGRIASLMGVEGGDYMENSLSVLRQFYAQGARYMTLTWNATLPWVDAAQDVARSNGLSRFGYEVVREMNRLGMLVDISHVSDSVMMQVLRTSVAPVIFSHSSARALADHWRNVPDAVLRMMPANGGVVMVNFYCDFVDSSRARLRVRFRGDSAGLRRAMEARSAANPATAVPSLGVVADHIEHIRRVAGVDHVGYGSDFDGIPCAPSGLDDVSAFPRLTAELLRRGWSDADVRKVIGGNFLRAMRQAEAVAARLQRERGPSTATIAELDSAGVRRP